MDTNLKKVGRLLTNSGAVLAMGTLVIAETGAQQTSPEAATRTDTATVVADEEVIVRGRRLSELEFDLPDYIREFIDEIAAPARSRGYARWQRQVCIGVHNLEPTAAQYIVDRISGVAVDVGLEAGEPGCPPQVNIVFVTDARETASLMVENSPGTFRPIFGNAGMDLGLEALDEFTQSDKAVRWWHVSMPTDARTGMPAVRFPGQPPPTILKTGASRLYDGIRDELRHVIVIVDATELAGTTWQQLADYLAVVSLAQIDPWTEPSAFDSILNLFSNPAAYSGLTDWDHSYLEALYSYNQERDARIQRSLIVSEIVESETR